MLDDDELAEPVGDELVLGDLRARRVVLERVQAARRRDCADQAVRERPAPGACQPKRRLGPASQGAQLVSPVQHNRNAVWVPRRRVRGWWVPPKTGAAA